MSAAASTRSTEDKLFAIGLGTCIEGLRSFSFSKRGEGPGNHNSQHNNSQRTTPPTTPQIEPAIADKGSSSASPASPSPEMNRFPLHNAPRRGPTGGVTYGSQDARGNLAVPPGAPASSEPVRLKKAAVKIVSKPAASPVAPVPVQEKPIEKKEIDVETPVKPTPPPTSTGAGSSLDALFANLTKGSSAVSSPAPSAVKVEASFASPSPAPAPADNGLDTLFARLSAKSPSPYPTPPMSTMKVAAPMAAKPSIETPTRVPKEAPKQNDQQGTAVAEATILADSDSESQYLEKALAYIKVLPCGQDSPAALVKAATAKLNALEATESGPVSSANAKKLQEKYVEAILRYLSALPLGGKKLPDATAITSILQEHNGNFLYLCSRLVDDQILRVEELLNDVCGLSKALLEVNREQVVPQPASTSEPKVAAPKHETKKAPSVTPKDTPKKPISYDPMDQMSAWPTREKRETVPGCRTIVLRGVGDLKTIHQLQAIIWGGRLEAISLTEAGKDAAVIKFMTPEGCEKYFNDTANGIVLPIAVKRTAAFAERQPGPNSVNDLLRNCTEGETTRCVRALDAAQDWSDAMLKKLAEGKNQIKRSIDTIIRRKTPGGRFYIEFRFANIYHALNFKRDLMEEEDWEPCTIGFSPDPCEKATGVHLDD